MIASLRPEVIAGLFTLGAAIVGGIVKLIVSMRSVRNENLEQHAKVERTLVRVETKVDMTHEAIRDVAARLDDHINGTQHGTAANVVAHPRHLTGGNSDVA